jgi:hypothetical protein
MATPRPSALNWSEVLARVERVLTEAAAEIDRRDAALAAAWAAPGVPGVSFDPFVEKASMLASSPARAEARVAQLDSALKDCEEALRQWLARAEATRQRLATWAEGAVG